MPFSRARLVQRLGVLLLALLWPLAAAASEQEEKAAELERLRGKIEQLKQELMSDRGRYDDLRRDLRRVDERIGTLARKLRELSGQLSAKVTRLAELEREQGELNGEVGRHRERLADQVRAAYAAGRQEYLKILLNQEDPAAVGRMLTYYDYLNRARSEQIGLLLDALTRLQAVRAEITDETRRLRQLKAEQVEQKQALEQTREEREAVIARLKREIASKDEQLRQMVVNERELETLVRALAEALADIPPEAGNFRPFGQQRGRLRWPAEGRLLAGFGNPRGANLKWQGVLIEAREGQDVRAVSHGRVAFADWLRGYGLLIIIDHDDGYMSLYGHNQSLYKETGDWVDAGEIIAAVGASGGHERTALYFEIRHDGKPTDPVRWCRR